MMNRTHQGFTLVETLIAITILVIAVVGPLYAVHRSLVASYTARDSLTATALAQEGLEFIRYKRDSNYLSGQSDWMSGLSFCQAASGCMIDPNAATQAGQIQAYAAAGAVLKLDGSYRYVLGSGTPTRFTRKVTITTVTATEVEVTSVVTWTTFQIPYSVTVSEHLYNWQ